MGKLISGSLRSSVSVSTHNETRVEARVNFSFRHFRIEKGTGTKMCPAIVSRKVTGDVPISYWPIFFPYSLSESPRSLC